MKERINKFLNSSMNRGLSWTTIASEKLLLAIIGISTCVASAIYLYEMILAREILLGDLFLCCSFMQRYLQWWVPSTAQTEFLLLFP